MCLDKITSEPDPNYKGIAYKVLDADMCSPVIYCTPHKIGERSEARSQTIYAWEITTPKREFTYESGFHCFYDIEDAKKYMFRDELLVEVEVENLLAIGTEILGASHKSIGVFKYITVKRVLGYTNGRREYHANTV